MKKSISIRLSLTLAIMLFYFQGCQNKRVNLQVMDTGALVSSPVLTSPIYDYYVRYFEKKHEAKGTGTAEKVGESISEIFEDKDGNLWFATSNRGLAQFDGGSLRYFTVAQGLSAKQINAMMEDGFGNIWLATEEGVFRYDGRGFTHFSEKEGLTDMPTWSLMEDSKGTVWAGTSDGLFRYAQGRFTAFSIPGVPSGKIWSMDEDKAGNLWFAVDGKGIVRYDGDSFTYFDKEDGLSDSSVLRVVADDEGTVWMGTLHGGLNYYRGGAFLQVTGIEELSAAKVSHVSQSPDGGILFSAEGKGIYQVHDGAAGSLSSGSRIREFGIESFHKDQLGRFWIGGSGGLYRLHEGAVYPISQKGPWKEILDGC